MTAPARICSNCWERRATPRFTRCTPCFFQPRRNRANAAWAHLIADTTIRKAA